MISEATISKVRGIDIEEVLKPYVSLKRKGSSLVGLCPFHSEKTPSFTVSSGKGLYHCFGCNRGGDPSNMILRLNTWKRNAVRRKRQKPDTRSRS